VRGDDGSIPDPRRAQTGSRSRPLQFRAGLLGVCLLALLMGAVGITDEGYVSLHGDPARHLMNGVYFLDLARDRPFASVSDFVEYTRLYYARYPALGLGHLPLLLPIAEAPMFAIFGVSILSARLVVLLAAIAAAAYLYLLVSELYGVTAGVFAAAFMATSPLLVVLTRSIMSEMPTVALLVASAHYFHRFCTTERRGPLAAFVLTLVLSVYAKQLAIFVFPAFLGAALVELGIRRLLKRDVLIVVGAIAFFSLPVIPLTLVMSPANVEFVRVRTGVHYSFVASIIDAILPQLSVPVLLLAAAGLAMAVVRRDRRVVLFVLWIGGVLGGLLIAGVLSPARYTIYWVPALSALAASTIVRARGAAARVVVVVLVLALGFQTWTAAHQHLVGAIGYEEAARFVIESDPGATVLFSGDIDTGYFSFFVRKHDPARRLVVLRSDKVLTTSKLGRPSVEDRIDRPEEIYRVLHTFGTRYVIIEDRPSRSRVLEWLRQELHSSKFVERKRIPIGTSDIRMPDTSLVIYEFVDRTPPDKDAVLDMHLPIIGQSVSVKLSDLVARKYLR
jgi:hypothetical protein